MEISYASRRPAFLCPIYLIRLKEAGLGSIPGTAAEISTTRCAAI